MRLTVFTDYTLRVLIYLALHPDRFVTINEIAGAYGISSNHLMKVTRHLAASGDVVSLRGAHGGLRLGRPAEAIRIGDVVRRTETFEAFGTDGPRTAIEHAMAAFFRVLDGYSVADLAGGPGSDQAGFASDQL